MQFSTTAILLSAAAALASASNVNVVNNCPFDVFTQFSSQAVSSNAPVRVAQHGGAFSVPLSQDAGSLLKFGQVAQLPTPLQFQWTYGYANNVYASVGEAGSNPIAVQYRSSFAPDTRGQSIPNCNALECNPGDDACYRSGPVSTCPPWVDWKITLCV